MPFLVALVARDARRHDQLVGAVAVQHEALRAVEHIAGAVLLRRGRDVGEVVARLPLGMREGEQRLAGRDLRQQRRPARRRSRRAAGSRRRARRSRNTARARARGRTPPSRSWSRPAPPPMPPCSSANGSAVQAELDILLPQRAAPAVRLLPCISCAPRNRSAASVSRSTLSFSRRCSSESSKSMITPCMPMLPSCPRAGGASSNHRPDVAFTGSPAFAGDARRDAAARGSEASQAPISPSR